ncbi:SDR family NAD(P)-dependent oxidoreductase [Parasphingopyxis marina]|nr:SDR family NAD(P)-dependent oxidoreductase [Parasphingopyxis marina]
MLDLAGKTAVVTGAGSGLGEAIARHCVGLGGRTVLADIDEANLERVAGDLAGQGAELLAVPADVASRSAMEAMADACFERFDDCDYLFNNAGVVIHKPLADCSTEDWQRIIDVNLIGVANGIAAFVPRMIAAGRGHVVNVASMAGLVPLDGFGIYVASKYAVVGLSEVLAAELAPAGVDVTVACPGWIATAIQNEGGDVAPAFAPELMRVITADDAARIILDAVERKCLFAPTHPEWRSAAAQRADRLLSAFDSGR